MRAVFVAECGEAFDAEAVRGHLRAQVRQALARDLAVEQHEVEHVLIERAGAVEAHGRDAQTFLVDMGVASVGEVGVVGEVNGPRNEGIADETGSARTMSGRCVPPPA